MQDNFTDITLNNVIYFFYMSSSIINADNKIPCPLNRSDFIFRNKIYKPSIPEPLVGITTAFLASYIKSVTCFPSFSTSIKFGQVTHGNIRNDRAKNEWGLFYLVKTIGSSLAFDCNQIKR